MITIYLITSLLVIILIAFVFKLIPILRNLNELIQKDHKTLYGLILEAHQYITCDDFVIAYEYPSMNKILIRWSHVTTVFITYTKELGPKYSVRMTNGKEYMINNLPPILESKL